MADARTGLIQVCYRRNWYSNTYSDWIDWALICGFPTGHYAVDRVDGADSHFISTLGHYDAPMDRNAERNFRILWDGEPNAEG